MNARKHWVIYSSVFIGLIGAFLWYHFRYVPSQKRDFAGRLLRVLATTAAEINSELQSVVPPLTNTIGLAIEEATKGSPPPTNWMNNLARRTERLRHVESVLEVQGSSNVAAKATIEFNVRAELEPPGWEIKARQPVATTNVIVHIRLAIDALITPLLHRKEFDHLVILDKQKKVIYQRGSPDFRLFQFPSFNDTGTFQTNWAAGSGAEFVVLGQPWRFTLPLSDTAHEMMLCGLVGVNRFERRSSEISFSVMIGLCFLVLLLILAWPFLDARVAGLERVRAFDVFSLIFSMLLGVWVITFSFLLLVSYLQLQSGLDRDLKVIANRINHNFRDELVRAAAQLQRLDGMIGASQLTTDETNIYADMNIAEGVSLVASNAYPFFQMVFWTDSRGQQVAKATRKNVNTRFIDVSSRDYFRRVIHDETWRIKTRTNTYALAIESIYSRNTGENMAVVAMRSSNYALVALDVNFLSFTDALLPADFGFCILDADGKVLFHSDKSRNLRENFFAECNHHSRLQSVVRSRSTDRFDVSYAGQEHSVYLRPIEQLPWTLAVFRNERFAQTGNLVASSIALAYGLAGVAVSMGVYLVANWAAGWRWAGACVSWFGRRVWRRVWERGGTPARYFLASIMNVVLGIVAIWWTRYCCSGAVAPLLFVFAPVVVTLLNWLLLQKLPTEAYTLKARRWLYTMAFGSIVFLVAGVPSIVSFVCVFGSEIELLARRNQLHLAEAEANRSDRVRATYADVVASTNIASAHATNLWGAYYASLDTFKTDFNPPTTNTGHNCPSLVFAFPRIRNLYTQFENDSLSYISAGAHDGAWEWTRPDLDTLKLELEKLGVARSPGVKYLVISSTLPQYPRNSWWLAAAVLLGLVLSIICVWFVRRFIVERPGEQSTAEVAEKISHSRWYLLRGPLMFVVLLAGLYYFTTQRALWENSLTLLTGFAAGITALVNVIKLLSDKTRDSHTPSAPAPAKEP